MTPAKGSECRRLSDAAVRASPFSKLARIASICFFRATSACAGEDPLPVVAALPATPDPVPPDVALRPTGAMVVAVE
jgi:hypothetical protein